MARANPFSDLSDPEHEPLPGEWQALRGELVALLDQVEGRYARVEPDEPVLSGLAQRVRHLRDQVERPEPAVRRREALRTVKRAVDRFSDRDDSPTPPQEDLLSSAIAEIRGRQMSGSVAALGHRPVDMPEFRELSGLVGGLSGRLERLETELRAQRASNGSVRDVANQVEQLTHVVELLAGAVGETGQVKRLEAQIAALGAMIEDAPKVDLGAVNNRLDDVSATVAKLAELQAQQMEREIVREDRKAAEPVRDSVAELAPSMHAIESSVRNVYDRIDAIEKNVALSSGEFEHLTSAMAAFTQAMKDGSGQPGKLVAKVDALAARIGDFEAANGDIVGLKSDISALRDAVLAGMEPRFSAIEQQLGDLSSRMAAPADTSQVEHQLKLLMTRMDETGAQLNGLAKLYSSQDGATDREALATLVAERTSEAMTRKAPAPVAMFGPDSLKSIESQLTGLIRSASKAPDYESLAAMVAEKTSAAVAKATPSSSPAQPAISEESMTALEKRMTAVFNTAGRDTAERLARLEAKLSPRPEAAAAPTAPAPASEARPVGKTAVDQRLDTMLAALGQTEISPGADRMPANPSDDAPLRDPGVGAPALRGPRDDGMALPQTAPKAEPAAQRPAFDPASVERPPRPQSSLAKVDADPFAPVASTPAPAVDAPAGQNSTSTFVAAARRAQRARQETAAPAATSNSLIGRALARVRPASNPTGDVLVEEPLLPKPAKPAKPAKVVKEKPVKAAKSPVAPPTPGDDLAGPPQSFITRHRRPLLLSLTLVVVSMLALNLVMQRMAPAQSGAAAVAETPAETTPETPAAVQSGDVSALERPTRVIDMIDTASINPGAPMTFTDPSLATPMPPTLQATPAAAAGAPSTIGAIAPTPVEPAVTGSIADTAAAAPETFPLPPEAVGPLELREAAAKGDARAQFEVGAIYTEGRALPADPAEAAKWYERSAAQGFSPSQYRLGNLYEVGQGVEKDLEVARLWYQRSAEAGNRMAMHNLAALYAGGQLGEQQFDAAAEWFERAAGLGMTDSQFNLGMLYARGLGVEQDFEQSYKWFALASANGDADATKARDDMGKSLTAEAVGRISAEVDGWKAQPINLAANFAPLGTWSDSFAPGEPITNRDVVIKVQQALVKLGYDIGVPDGVAGPKTAAAVRTFETGTGMSESGSINPRLLAVLGSQPV